MIFVYIVLGLTGALVIFLGLSILFGWDIKVAEIRQTRYNKREERK